jgi:hypothetical protein
MEHAAVCRRYWSRVALNGTRSSFLVFVINKQNFVTCSVASLYVHACLIHCVVSVQMAAAANTNLGQSWMEALKEKGVIEGHVAAEKTIALLKVLVATEMKQNTPKTCLYVKSTELPWKLLIGNPSTTWIRIPTLEFVIAKMKADGIHVGVYGDGDGNPEGLLLEPYNLLMDHSALIFNKRLF